jgi:hypothetical protein
MPHRQSLDFDAWITVHRRHPISCDVLCEEAQFRMGPNGSGLVLCFTWPALTKFVRVARKAVELSNQGLRPGPANYVVYADDLSHQIHNPGGPHPEEKQIILRVASTKKDQQ